MLSRFWAVVSTATFLTVPSVALHADPPGGIQTRVPPSLTDKNFDLAGAPPALSTVPIPTPPDLEKYVRDVDAARRLGKALFWDMQVGGDGFTACASCHAHAGADVRPKNTLSPHGPGTPISPKFRGANYQLKPEDFPFRKLKSVTERKSAVVFDTSEVAGSQGVIKRDFLGVQAERAVDSGATVPDPVFSINGTNARQVTGRNALSVINAVFYDRQFWDGRANRYFNGVNPFGDTDTGAMVWRYDGNAATQVRVLIDNASLASQAVGPPNNDVEMSWSGRTFPLLGRKMLSLRPLALQAVDSSDSLLGGFAQSGGKGLIETVTYASMIRDAFQPEWWQSPTAVDGEFTQMEANFSLMWGLSLQLYQATLVSDQSPYDRFMQGDKAALSDVAKQGLELFLNQGKCINCHGGAEFAGGTVSALRPLDKQGNTKLIERMLMGNNKIAVYDNGYYNIGVRPTAEDLGVGATGPFGPFSYSARRQQGQDIGDPTAVSKSERIAVNGAFKTPTLRNIQLTGPYFHNGGQATLTQVVQFYARGGDFHEANIADLDPDIVRLPEIVGNAARIRALVEFMNALTDPRVEFQRAPFDHPELIVVNGHSGVSDGVAIDATITLPATGASGGGRLKTFEEVLAQGPTN
jgi:cytochrome c peroxidase